MMDNASALPTRAQQQQQQKLLLIIVDQKLPTRLRDEALFIEIVDCLITGAIGPTEVRLLSL
jgi:hypothetical protein